MSKVGTSLVILVVTLFLFYLGGLIQPNTSNCLLNIMIDPSNGLTTCQYYSFIIGILTAFSVGGIIVGLFLPTRLDQVAAIGFTGLLITTITPLLISIWQAIALINGSALASILIAPLILLMVQSAIDWWRSPSA